MRTKTVKSRKFPFWEVMIRTLIYAFDNKKLFYRSAIFWSVLILDEIVCGFPLFGYENSGFPAFLSFLVYFAAMSSISVFVFRYILLGENKKGINISFGKTEFCYFAYFTTMVMIMSLPIFVFLISVYYIYQSNPQDVFEAFYMLFILFFFYVVYSRVNLVFPSISVGKGANVKKAFVLTRGNSLRIFTAFLAITFMAWIFFSLSLEVINAFPIPDFFGSLLKTIVFTFFIYLYAFIYAVLFAHIYQNLFYRKEK